MQELGTNQISDEIEGIELREQWHAIGEYLAPAILKTLTSVETLVKKLTNCEVWMLERDALPFFIANQYNSILSCKTKLLPASSSILGKGVRYGFDSAISWYSHNIKDETALRADIQVQLDYLILDPLTKFGLVAFCRTIYSNLDISTTFSDQEITDQLEGKLAPPKLGKKLKNILMFDTQQIGTYIEITAAIIHRLFPEISCRGVLLESRNPRIPSLVPAEDGIHIGVGCIENIPKPYELVAPVDGRVRYKLRNSKIAEYWVEFCWGLERGIANALSKKPMHSQQTPILIKKEHIEPNLWSSEPGSEPIGDGDTIFNTWDPNPNPPMPTVLF